MHTCKICGKDFEKDWRSNKRYKKENPIPEYCSLSCSRSRPKSIESNRKRIDSLYKFYGTKPKYCTTCNKKLNHRNKSGFCRECFPSKTKYEHLRAFRHKRKEYLVNYKGGKCEICGYNKCLGALDFHHLDPSTKDFNISNTTGLKTKTLELELKELEKCILVCSNCHRELHYLENNA